MTRVGALWIGGLEPYMDEPFLSGAMMALGQDGIVSIKVMNNRCTGQPAGYGFINFESDQKAIYVMHRLGGKVIPNSSPPVRFKLNHNSTRLQPGEIDTSVWVGDLSPDVDDFLLYQFFTARYSSVRCAKVVLDEGGLSKGYGFVRFGLETEQQHALANMTGEHGLGSKPIKVSMANQKNRRIPDNNTPWGGGPPMHTGSDHGGHGNNNEPWATSPPTVAATAPWPPNSNTPSNLPPPPAPHTPDYNLYQYYQYAQQINQQQYAAAWSAWQQQQQQQQQ